MIVDDLDLPSVAITPDKADTPLLVDANAMVPKSVATKSFQPVARRDSQIIKATSRIDCKQPGTGPLLDLHGEPANSIASEDSRSALTGKGFDHELP